MTRDFTLAYDNEMHATMSALLDYDVLAAQWAQIQLPIKSGGLALRSTAVAAPILFLQSFLTFLPLCRQFDKSFDESAHITEDVLQRAHSVGLESDEWQALCRDVAEAPGHLYEDIIFH
jgi:hypothetical protein